MLPFGPLLGVAALLLLGGPPTQAAQGSSSHSLRHFCTSVSEPGQGLPQFISVGYVDDQVICQYDSNSRRVRRRVAWMEKADAQYWDAQTQIMRGKEAEFRGDMVTLKKRYNQSEGFHTWQEMSSCELRKDGSKGGHLQYAYDGRDFISLDLETLTWTAADVPAQTTKKEWEAEPAIAESSKVYLEEDCIEWLQKFLDYGKEMLLRIQIIQFPDKGLGPEHNVVVEVRFWKPGFGFCLSHGNLLGELWRVTLSQPQRKATTTLPPFEQILHDRFVLELG
ncbi:H-2 class I histocompatibility antigen, Q9 alpha chain-like isoform X2 [Sceloporus undulatus]|uniref:H-2 class I histocompatibility antigen, Q9 alpha chain-like isoform X2 n=1 Tax=Sceloporus undulatus TaxID=8520 RepID=UPI001C4AAC7E|nr:H-2 class I histocompatibility antigen, Q9 alpha chain-like isoform X2 [Sceloporus undulatus]